MTFKLPVVEKKLPCDNGISYNFFFTVLLYIVNKHKCNMFTMYSFFNKLLTVTGNNNTTRLHSSRMRTAGALTVSPDMLCTGEGAGVWGGGCLLGGSAPREVSALGGGLLPGGLLLGVSALEGWLLWGGVYSKGCLLWGVSAPKGGVSAPKGGGVCSWWGVVASKHALRQTPPAVNRITHACENIALPQLRCGR